MTPQEGIPACVKSGYIDFDRRGYSWENASFSSLRMLRMSDTHLYGPYYNSSPVSRQEVKKSLYACINSLPNRPEKFVIWRSAKGDTVCVF